ncbi:MAG: YcjX family protein [Gammaproteobacteria bacterium]|nr:YcjX family protein [Gammaproteobacteria bacterium]
MNRTLDRSVRLAVTGLSRSGKTVFITSLVHNLMHGLDGAHLPFFDIANSGRLRAAKPQQQPDMHIPAFRYDVAIEKLSGDPSVWPKRTDGISEIRLAIRYRPGNSVLQHLTPVNTLYLDIVDYPGEWLLDLPLMEQTYDQWSAHIADLCDKEPRLSLSAEWRAYLDSIDITAPADADTIRKAGDLYTEFLYRCKDKKYGLSLLQPGRFTMAGDLKGAPLLEFCPLPKIPPGTQSSDSLYGVMKLRYESYKEHVVRKFYREHFSSFDRQIVLVDMLQAFNTGYATFQDMREAIDLVLKSFHYGKSGLFNRLFKVKIDKLLFAATKADHVTPNQLPNLERFLQQMLVQANNNVIFEGVETDTLALASIKCTQAVHTQFQGQQISCIKGIPNEGDKPIALFPGEVPVEIPAPEEWVKERFNFIEFRPPRLTNTQSSGLPHIRMDRALQFLLGDKF